jgi:hypothetical protein
MFGYAFPPHRKNNFQFIYFDIFLKYVFNWYRFLIKAGVNAGLGFENRPCEENAHCGLKGAEK